MFGDHYHPPCSCSFINIFMKKNECIWNREYLLRSLSLFETVNKLSFISFSNAKDICAVSIEVIIFPVSDIDITVWIAICE